MPFTLEIMEKTTGEDAKDFNSFTSRNGGVEAFLRFTKRVLIRTARDALKREQDQGFDKKPRVRVDNRFEKPIEQVQPIGKIEYFSRVDLSLALLRIYRELEKRSPRVTGQYVSGNRVIIGNREVARSEAEFRAFLATGKIAPNAKIRFLNVNPYARRLENKGIVRGTRGRFAGQKNVRGEKKRVSSKTGRLLVRPNGAYYLTFLFARRNFKQIAQNIKFSYMPGGTDGITIPDLGPGFRNAFQQGKRGVIGRPYIYPSIVIRLAQGGLNNV